MIDKKTLHSLTKINNVTFYIKLAILSALLLFSFYLMLSDNILLSLLGMFIAGAMYAHAVELQHQCLHYTAFNEKNKNKFFGILLGLPMFVKFSQYREEHLKHHKNLGTKDNKEFFDDRFKRYKELFKNINFNNMESVAILILPTLTFTLLFFNNFILVKIWLLPVLIFGEIIHFLVELPEHYKCNNFDKNPLMNSRTIKGSLFSFWFTNGNNFHIEHHTLAAVPIDKLPILHNLIQKEIVYYEKKYLDFYLSIFTNKLKK